jgi:hypothetical protein
MGALTSSAKWSHVRSPVAMKDGMGGDGSGRHRHTPPPVHTESSHPHEDCVTSESRLIVKLKDEWRVVRTSLEWLPETTFLKLEFYPIFTRNGDTTPSETIMITDKEAVAEVVRVLKNPDHSESLSVVPVISTFREVGLNDLGVSASSTALLPEPCSVSGHAKFKFVVDSDSGEPSLVIDVPDPLSGKRISFTVSNDALFVIREATELLTMSEDTHFIFRTTSSQYTASVSAFYIRGKPPVSYPTGTLTCNYVRHTKWDDYAVETLDKLARVTETLGPIKTKLTTIRLVEQKVELFFVKDGSGSGSGAGTGALDTNTQESTVTAKKVVSKTNLRTFGFHRPEVTETTISSSEAKGVTHFQQVRIQLFVL